MTSLEKLSIIHNSSSKVVFQLTAEDVDLTAEASNDYSFADLHEEWCATNSNEDNETETLTPLTGEEVVFSPPSPNDGDQTPESFNEDRYRLWSGGDKVVKEGDFRPYDNQVSGHLPLIACGQSTIGKPALPQEVAFYEAILAIFPKLRRYCPRYLGCCDMSLRDVMALGEKALSIKDSEGDDDSEDIEYSPMKEEEESLWKLDIDGECVEDDDLQHSRQQAVRAGKSRRRSRQTSAVSSGGGQSSTSTMRAKMWAKFMKMYCRELGRCDTGPNRSVRFIMLEDLIHPFREGAPCVLDIKMGTRQYRAAASFEKQQRQRMKSSSTTTEKFGLRLNGMRVWQTDPGAFVTHDKYWGRSVNGDTLEAAFTQFFYNGQQIRVDAIPPLLHLLEGLATILQSTSSCRFYSSSLLIIYDGAIPAAGVTGPPMVDVRLIDFANSLCTLNPNHPPPSSFDAGHDGSVHPADGCMLGIQNIIELLKKIQRNLAVDEFEGTDTPEAP